MRGFACGVIQVSKKRVLEAEFGVLVQLSFDLHEDPRDIFHHFVLLLKVTSRDDDIRMLSYARVYGRDTYDGECLCPYRYIER